MENAFGILGARFMQSITTDSRTRCHKCYASCLCLHYLAQFSSNKERPKLLPPGMMDSEDEHVHLLPGFWRGFTGTQDLCDLKGDADIRASTLYAREIRANLKKYFYDEGAVEFQWQMVE